MKHVLDDEPLEHMHGGAKFRPIGGDAHCLNLVHEGEEIVHRGLFLVVKPSADGAGHAACPDIETDIAVGVSARAWTHAHEHAGRCHARR
jgi:hypothetical protein